MPSSHPEEGGENAAMWKRLFGLHKTPRQAIIIVSGLPRSGTSMMMRMLEAGGIDIVTDHIRPADADNPAGYYELEKVKTIKDDASFLDASHGKALKMVSLLLRDLPSHKHYKIIFMRRGMTEVLASQRIMLQRRGKERSDDDQEMGKIFTRHLDDITAWLDTQPHMDVIYVNYSDVMARPLASAETIRRFLGNRLNPHKMASVVDPSLYRNRAPRD
jgi:hypothetical protein